MPLKITFELSDEDLQHFQHIVDTPKSSIDCIEDANQVEHKTVQLIEKAKSGELPGYIATRLARLERVMHMLADTAWQLTEKDRIRVVSALAYICDPKGLIPDHTPGLGFIDDAIYLELVLHKLGKELELYEEFCEFREEQAKSKDSNPPSITRQDWLEEKRKRLDGKYSDENNDMTRTIWGIRW